MDRDNISFVSDLIARTKSICARIGELPIEHHPAEYGRLALEISAFEVKYMLLTSGVFYYIDIGKISKSEGQRQLESILATENLIKTAIDIHKRFEKIAIAGGVLDCELKLGAPAEYLPTEPRAQDIKEGDVQRDESELEHGKGGTFDPLRHFNTCWKHITATENEDEIDNLEKLVSTLNEYATRDKVLRQKVSIAQVRYWLNQIGRSDLYKNAALIKTKMSGITPPAINESTKAQMKLIMKKIIDVSGTTGRKRKNRSYYQFYCMKVLHLLLPSRSSQRRIFEYFHLQSEETLINDDIDWKEICAKVGLKYVPTNRNTLYNPLTCTIDTDRDMSTALVTI